MVTRQESLWLSEPVEPEEFSRRVSRALGDSLADVRVQHGHVCANVGRDSIVEVAQTLRNDSTLSCTYFTFLSAIDWEEEGFEMVVTLFSLRYSNTVVLKIRLPSADARLPTLSGVFGGANWHERECAEMFGITFEGHPNPKKLYLTEDFEGHPLLKSFKLASRTYKAWPGAKDPEEAAGGGRG